MICNVKLPKLRVSNDKEEWRVAVKHGFRWCDYIFSTYKSAYDFYLHELFGTINEKQK